MRAGKQLTETRNEIVMAALQNAVETIFIEKSAPNTVDDFVSVAVASVWCCIEGNAYTLTPKQIERIEKETSVAARGAYGLHFILDRQ